jgi:hypothetical protein
MAFLCPSPSAPATPDYAAAATAQGVANKDTAITQGYLNNPNIVGPLGGQTVTFDPVTNQPTITQNLTPTAQATLEAQQRVQQGLAGLGEKGLTTASGIISKPFEYTGPSGIFSVADSGKIAGAPDLAKMGSASGAYTGAQATGGVAAPQLQQSYSNYGTVQNAPDLASYGSASSIGADKYGLARGDVAANQYGLAQGNVAANQYGLAGGINPSQYGTAQGGVQGVNLQQSLGNIGQINQNLNANNYLSNNQLDLRNVAQMPVNAGTTGQAAIMSRLAPQLERQQKLNAQNLANQGLVAGGEAYKNAMLDQSQQQNDLLTQAALQGISLDTAANQQGFNQALASGQYGNLGTQQNFSNALAAQQAQNAAQGQGFTQQLQSGQFGNQAQLASFGANLQNQQAQNQAIAQNFGQGLSAQQLANQSVAQNFGQGITAQNAANSAVAQNFGQGLAAQQASNQAIGQNFGQGMTASNAANAAIQQNQNTALQQQAAANQAQAQQYAQAQANAQFANQAQLAGFGANLQNQQASNAAIGQNYQQGMGTQAAQNQALAQNQGVAAQQQQLANAAQLQQYNENLGGAQFANNAATQELQKQLALRNQPLNEITGLMSGSQLQMPQFQGYNPTNIAPAPVFAGAQAQGAANMQNYGIQQSGANATTSGLFSLAGAALSDRRLKSNIERIGTHKLGIGVYEYDILGERQQGVMADEVEKVMPEAVLMHPSGYKMVNYGLLNG